VPARLINIKYITTRAEKVASPVTALHPLRCRLGCGLKWAQGIMC